MCGAVSLRACNKMKKIYYVPWLRVNCDGSKKICQQSVHTLKFNRICQVWARRRKKTRETRVRRATETIHVIYVIVVKSARYWCGAGTREWKARKNYFTNCAAYHYYERVLIISTICLFIECASNEKQCSAAWYILRRITLKHILLIFHLSPRHISLSSH